MKRQKCFGVLSLVIGIVMLLGCGARVLLAEQKNKPVKSGFSAAELDPGRTDAKSLHRSCRWSRWMFRPMQDMRRALLRRWGTVSR